MVLYAEQPGGTRLQGSYHHCQLSRHCLQEIHHLQDLNVVIPLGIPMFCTGSVTHIKQIVCSSCSEDSRIYDFLPMLPPVKCCLVLVVINSTLINGEGRHGGLNSASGPLSSTQTCHSCAEND